MAEVVKVQTSQDLWTTLERAYNHHFDEGAQIFCDSLHHLKKGNLFISAYAKQFKFLCDHLQAIDYLVDLMDITLWFLCGLGPAFETFSITQRVVHPPPSFIDLVSRDKGHELF